MCMMSSFFFHTFCYILSITCITRTIKICKPQITLVYRDQILPDLILFVHCAESMWPWSTKPVLSHWGVYVTIANNTLYGSKLLIFFFYAKIIRLLIKYQSIFCKFPTVNISKPNFWLIICIAKNFIWTTLKAIFSIFRFFCTLRFQIFKQLYLG